MPGIMFKSNTVPDIRTVETNNELRGVAKAQPLNDLFLGFLGQR